MISVSVNVFGDNSLVVRMQRQAFVVERAGACDDTGLDTKCVVASVAILIDPLTDGIAGERRLDVWWPGLTVSMDSPQLAKMLLNDVSRVWKNHEFELIIG